MTDAPMRPPELRHTIWATAPCGVSERRQPHPISSEASARWSRRTGHDPLRQRTAGIQVMVTDSERFASAAADVVAELVRSHPNALLGVATGRTPEPVYDELVRIAAAGLDCSGLTLAALDEYVGIAPDDPRSYHQYVMTRIARPLGIPEDRVLLPQQGADGRVDYDAELAARGGVDLQIAGIGRNGHIGFNEPGSAPDSRTRVVTLTPTTRADNAEFFGGDPEAVPGEALTQGVGTVLAARTVLLLASGGAKREALQAALEGPVTPDVPASALQNHPDVVVIADHDAAGR